MTNRLTVTTVGAALMLGGASVLMIAGPAQAAVSSFATQCTPPPISGLPPVNGTTAADITAPATAKVGDEVEVVWKTVQAASKNPDIIDLEADTVLPTGEITVGGAQNGTVKVTGTRTNPPIPKNSEMKLSDMKGTLKLTKAGDVTLSPGDYTINVSKPISTDTTCKPTASVPVAVTIKVTDGGGASGGTTGGTTGTTGTTGGTGATGGTSASGGTSTTGGASGGGTSTGGTGGTSASGGTGDGSTGGTSGASSGGLAQTGASDEGALRALGLVAGTVLLLGGAVFTFTPWRRLRR